MVAATAAGSIGELQVVTPRIPVHIQGFANDVEARAGNGFEAGLPDLRQRHSAPGGHGCLVTPGAADDIIIPKESLPQLLNLLLGALAAFGGWIYSFPLQESL